MSDEAVKVLVFSDDVDTRQAVVAAIGVKPGKDAPRVDVVEAATKPGVMNAMKENTFGALILDGESVKEGGTSIAREVAGIFDNVPPIIILTARPQDDWIASWAGAASTVQEPLNPLELQEKLSALLSPSVQ